MTDPSTSSPDLPAKASAHFEDILPFQMMLAASLLHCLLEKASLLPLIAVYDHPPPGSCPSEKTQLWEGSYRRRVSIFNTLVSSEMRCDTRILITTRFRGSKISTQSSQGPS